MRKRIWIVAIVIICIAIIMTMTVLSGCVNHLEDEVVIGDFVCQEWSNNTIHLKNLSEEGRKKKYIVVPTELDGKKVTMLGYNDAIFSTGRSNWTSENLVTIYVLGKEYNMKRQLLNSCINLSKVVIINDENKKTEMFDGKGRCVFISQNKKFATNYSEMDNIHAANISYYYNYEDSPNNGYYWIDDVEDGEVIEYIPDNPTREGYKFEGWYKETECINKWDFEKDKVIKAKNDEPYYENKLFAKWAKE